MPQSDLTSENYVIIRAWSPTYNGKVVSYLEAVMRRTFTPGNSHAHIGHIAICIRHGDRTQYISLYPTESHYFSTSPVVNHTLQEDIRDQENLPATMQTILFSLDTKKMLEEFDSLQPVARWFLSGVKIINLRHEKIYNCSSYVEHLLNKGGIYDNLLSKKQKLSKPMTPEQVCKLAESAATVEQKIFPHRNLLLKKHFQEFSDELIIKSQNKENPCKAIDHFLQENPDFHLRAIEFDPHFLEKILSIVYKNIQQSLDEHLLQLAENDDLNTNSNTKSLIKLSGTLNSGATLSLFNKDGLNAFHLLIKNNCLEGVKLLLEKFPFAIKINTKNELNQSPLDLAITSKAEPIIRFLKKKLGINQQPTQTLNFQFFNIKNQTPETNILLTTYQTMKKSLSV